MYKLYLTLEDGSVFEGEGFGAKPEQAVMGEVVFDTGMAGYLETLTDKRNHGRVVVQTFPLAGNYGVISADFESQDAAPRAYIVKEWCRQPSNFRSEGALGAFLKERGVVGMSGVDTRRLTRAIRDGGPMNAAVSTARDAVDAAKLKDYKLTGACEAVSTAEQRVFEGVGPHAVILDCGANESTIRGLLSRGCRVTLMPCGSPLAEILARKPDGVLLSEGPGDPSDNAGITDTIRGLLDTGLPMLGVGLGHQLLALAFGLKTVRMGRGHHGGNLPARHVPDGKIYITAQNHSCKVDASTLTPSVGRELFVNVNDGSNEGIEYAGRPVFSSQFRPDPRGGPQNPSFLYDVLIKHMEEAHAKG